MQTDRRSKLTVEAVQSIRRAASAGATNDALAAQYGVHPSTISRIATGKAWQIFAETPLAGVLPTAPAEAQTPEEKRALIEQLADAAAQGAEADLRGIMTTLRTDRVATEHAKAAGIAEPKLAWDDVVSAAPDLAVVMLAEEQDNDLLRLAIRHVLSAMPEEMWTGAQVVQVVSKTYKRLAEELEGSS